MVRIIFKDQVQGYVNKIEIVTVFWREFPNDGFSLCNAFPVELYLDRKKMFFLQI